MFIQTLPEFQNAFAPNTEPGRVRMTAKLFQQIATRSQAIEKVIRFDAPCRTVSNVTIKRDYDAGPVDSFRNLRGGEPNHAPMPPVAGDHCRMRLQIAIRPVFKLLNCAIEYFTLGFLALAISRIQVIRQTTRLVPIVGFK